LEKDELTRGAAYGLRAKHDLLPVIVIGIADQHIRPKIVLMIESIDDLKAQRIGRIARSTSGKGERTQKHLTLWGPNRVGIGLRESGCGSQQDDETDPHFHNTLLCPARSRPKFGNKFLRIGQAVNKGDEDFCASEY